MAHTDDEKDLEAGSRLGSQYIDNKARLQNSPVSSEGSARSANSTRLKVPDLFVATRMPSFRHFLILFTIFTVFAVSYASGAGVQVRKHHAPTDDEIQFTRLLSTISDDPALHDALEQYILRKYHPETKGEGKTAFQFIRNENVAAGTNLVEIVKRQTNGTTTTTTTSITDPPETTTSVVVPPTTNEPPPTTTSDTPPPTSATSDTPDPTDSSTDTPPPTTTPESPTSPTTTPPGSTPTKSNPTTTPAPTPGGKETHTSTTKATTYTTTGADGTVSTVTAYTVVPAIEPTQNTGPSVTPGLQGAASKFDMVGVVGYGIISFVGLVAIL
ncbi:hypothetical protein V490_05116 [Pseudogymnoascus sp. VKM F-3557]|nr:hypothetical protein V490_05116 [Pseudogymnoascus sp. VKM F-3557]